MIPFCKIYTYNSHIYFTYTEGRGQWLFQIFLTLFHSLIMSAQIKNNMRRCYFPPKLKDSLGLAFFLFRMTSCSRFFRFLSSSSIRCFSSSMRLCSSTSFNCSSANFFCASSIFLLFSAIISSNSLRFSFSSSYKNARIYQRVCKILFERIRN